MYTLPEIQERILKCGRSTANFSLHGYMEGDVMCDLAISLLTMFIGACVAWFATWFYYKRAAQQLDAAAAELRRLNNLLLHGMEDAGWIELNRDPDSNKITGFRISVAGTSQGKATVSGTLEIQHDAESPLCGSFNE